MMKRSAWSRLWALVLTCMMLISMVPAEALGEGGVSGTLFATFNVSTEESTEQSYNLNDFLDVADLDMPEKDADGKPVMRPGVEYKLSLQFAETNSLQFSSSERCFTYTFPENVLPVELITAGRTEFTTTETIDGVSQTITVGMNYAIEEGKLVVTFDDTSDVDLYLKRFSDKSIKVDANIQYNGSQTEDEIKFSDNIVYPVIIPEGKVSVSKSTNQWNIQTSEDGTEFLIPYTVTVKSEGVNEHVVVTDALKNNAYGAKYKEGSLVIKDKTNNWADVTNNFTPTPSDSGFTCDFGTLEHGKEYELTYYVSIPRDEKHFGEKIEALENGVKVTYGDNKEDQAASELNIEKLPFYDGVDKAGVPGEIVMIGEGENAKRYQIVNWTITVNKEQLIDLTGKKLTDTITSDIMSFYGDGIKISDGSVTHPVTWEDLQVTEDSKSFTYTFPNQSGEKKAYTITYQTKVPLDDFSGQKEFKNDVSVDSGGSETGSVDIVGEQPGGLDNSELTKEWLGTDGVKTMSWRVTLTVPETASEIDVKDMFPQTGWRNNGNWGTAIDKVISDEGKITVTGLTTGENWNIIMPDPNNDWDRSCHFLFNLVPVEKSTKMRTITIEFMTAIDPAGWMNEWNHPTQTRENKVDATITVGQETKVLSASATGKFTSVIMMKEGWYTGKADDGMPIFWYSIKFGGIERNEITITDDFNTELFEIYGHRDWGSSNVHATLTYKKDDGSWNETSVNVPLPEDGKTFKLTLPLDENGEMYDHFTLSYCLKVKDEAALQKLIELADQNGGAYPVANTATLEGYERSASATNTYTFEPVRKSMQYGPSAANRYVGKFQIEVNPEGRKLNTAEGFDTLDVVDVMTNLRLVEGTVKVKDGNNQDLPATYYISGNTIHFTVPDGQRVVITYDARVIGNGDKYVTIENSAHVTGYAKGGGIKETIDMSSQAEITGGLYSISIKKISSLDGKGLNGATFELYEIARDGTEKLFGTYTTENDGRVFIQSQEGCKLVAYDGPAGNGETTGVSYRLEEITAPDGYQKGAKVTFKLYKDTSHMDLSGYPVKDGTITVLNVPLVYTEILKVRENGEALEGAALVLTNEEGAEIARWLSINGARQFAIGDGEGMLQPGKSYTLSEVKAPNGYVDISSNVVFTVDENGQITVKSAGHNYAGNVEAAASGNRLTVTNLPLPKLSIRKVDEEGKPVAGATLALHKDSLEGEVIQRITTTAESNAMVFESGLEEGAYYLVEEKFPDGYVDDAANNYSRFVVNRKGEIVNASGVHASIGDKGLTLYIKNEKEPEPVELSFIKVDANSNAPLSGATLELDGPDSFTETWTTDGTAHVISLAAGEYTLKETSVPDGYSQIDAITFTVDEDGKFGAITSGQSGAASLDGDKLTLTVKNSLFSTDTTDVNYGVEKVWADGNENHADDTIEVELHQKWDSGDRVAQDGGGTERRATLSKDNHWNFAWEDLPLNGWEAIDENTSRFVSYSYYVKESQVPEGYRATYDTTTDSSKTIITNIPLIDYTVEKVWEDNDNEAKLRPASIEVTLSRQVGENGTKETVETITLPHDGKWSYTWSELDKVDAQGKEYTYTVEEKNVPKNYESKVTGTTITNTLKTTSYEVEKKWVGDEESNRPASITVKLLQNNKEYKTAELTASGNWSYSWTNLPAEDAQGKEYTYTVDEVNVPTNYTKSVKTDGTKTTITNTRNTETTSLSVEKVWVGGVGAESVKVQLYRDDVALGDPVELNAENEWKHDWTNLVAGEVKDGAWVTYTYKLDEENVPTNYTKTVEIDGTKTTITNTLETTSYEVEKVWEDNNNEAKLRPESIEVQLLQNDEAYGEAVTVKANENGKWTHTWTNLPAKDAEGDEYTYKVEEVKVNGYDVTYDTTSTPDKKITKTTITNKKIVTPAPSTVAPTTVAPTTVAPTTVAPTTVAPTTVAPTTVAPTTAAPTTVAPTTVAPTTVAPTTVAPTTAAPTTVAPTTVAPTTVAPTTPIPTDEPTPIPTDEPTPAPTEIPVPTPTPIPEFTAVRVVKVWQDFEDYDQIRPESVTIHLQRRVNGGDYETVDTIELTGEGDIWSYTFRRLPTMNERGLLYQYRVREEEVEGYAVQYNGYTITNVHAAVTPTPEPTPEPTPTPTPTPLPTPVVVNPTPERATGMQYIDGEWYWIDDMGVPLGVVAQTGDDDNLAAALVGMAVLIVLAGALAFMIIKKEKRKHS